MHCFRWQPLGLVALIALLFPTDAFAYLDPGSGSLIFQTIVATLAGVAYGVRLYWGRIRAFVSRRRSGAAPADDISASEPHADPKNS